MLTKNKCENCKFYKKHIFLGKKQVDNIGGSCLILNKTTKCIVDNKVVTFDLERECPLEKLNEAERLRECWDKLRLYIIRLESESDRLNNESQKLLLDIMIQMEKLENKGE